MENNREPVIVNQPEIVPEREPEMVMVTEPLVRPVEEIPVIKPLAEETLRSPSVSSTKSTKKKRRCPTGKHRSKKNRCKKFSSNSKTTNTNTNLKECPPHTFRSAISHRCRHKCTNKYRYNKSKKRCIRKKTD